ncbi:hypothetical protein L1049_011176 [Liquidambar formosana]|uniref:Uncharacterized protein n=1 Tax=Liquidambar formosana TaxID=63359 RepID=A0AAP0RR58_LIQFO
MDIALQPCICEGVFESVVPVPAGIATKALVFCPSTCLSSMEIQEEGIEETCGRKVMGAYTTIGTRTREEWEQVGGTLLASEHGIMGVRLRGTSLASDSQNMGQRG